MRVSLIVWLALPFLGIPVFGSPSPMPELPRLLPAMDPAFDHGESDSLAANVTGKDTPDPSEQDENRHRLTFTITPDITIVNEDGGATTITLTAEVNTGSPYATQQILPITIEGSGRTDAVDFENIPGFDIIIPANTRSGSASFTLTPENDDVDEVNETITIRSTNPLLNTTPTPITLQDDDAPPRGVVLRASTNALFEEFGEQEVTIFAEINPGPPHTTYAVEQAIPITVRGSQAPGVVKFAPVADFTITLPAETASIGVTITIIPENNFVDEANETITVTSTSPILSGGAFINLVDDDPTPSIVLTTSPSSVIESRGSTQITVNADWDGQVVFPADQTLPLTVRGSGIVPAVDFSPVPDFDLIIRQGSSSGTATFILTPVNDTEDENDETVTIGSSNALVSEPATLTLEDDDDAPGNIRLAADPSTITEGDGATSVTVTATIGSGTTFAETKTFLIEVSGSGNDDVVDFTSVSSFSIVFAPSQSVSTATIQIVPLEDDEDTKDETITLSGTDPSISRPAVIQLLDNDTAPMILLSADPGSVRENDGETDITVTATLQNTPSIEEDYTIPITVRGSGIDEAVDFMPVPDFDLVLDAGRLTISATFTLTPIDDTLNESDEIITIASTREFVANSPTVMLLDDDETPDIRLTATPTSIREDDGATEVTVTATVNGATQFGATQILPVTVTGSGVAEAVDFMPVPDFDLVLDAGRLTASATFTLTPMDDSLDESDEIITIASTKEFVVNSPAVTLLDDDETPDIRLAATPTSIREDDGATEVTVTATVNGATQFGATQILPVTVTGSGVPEAVDFMPVPDFNLVLDGGRLAASATFVLTPMDDTLDESDEIITIASAKEFVVNSPTVTLLDDDETPDIRLTATPASIREDDGATEVTVTAIVNGATQFGATQILPVTVTGSGVAEAVDFSPVADFNLVLNTGTTRTSSTFTLTPENDNEDEIDESVLIESSSSLVSQTATVMILDDDDPGQVQLSVNPSTVYEERGTQTVTVTGMIASGQAFSKEQVILLSIRGSGQADAVDFAPIPDIELVFRADLLTAATTFDLTPVDDQEFEMNELLTVSSTNPIIQASVVIQLLNDDEIPKGILLTTSPERIREDAGATTVTVTATVQGSTRYSTNQRIPLRITDSDDPNSVKYLPVTNPVLTIPSGQATGSVELEITPVNNQSHQPDGVITIGSPNDLVLETTTIILENDDDEPAGISVSLNPTILPEDAGKTEVALTVNVNGDTRYGVDKLLPLAGTGSGMPGAVGFSLDLPSALSLPAGEESASITFLVTPVDNRLDENNETLTITVGGDDLRATAELSLTDNDAEPGGFTLTVMPETVTEGDGPTVVNILASIAGDTRYAGPQILDLSVSEPTAGAVGFERIQDFQIEVPAGAGFSSGSFTLTPVENMIAETDATVTITAVHLGMTIRADLLIQDDDYATQRAADVNTVVLPEATRAMIASSVGAISGRIRTFRDGASQRSGFSRDLSSIATRLQHNQLQRYPMASSWASRLDQANLATRIKDRITVWAQADYRSLAGNNRNYPLRYDGNLTALHGGVDVSYGRFLFGLSVSRFSGDLDYEHHGVSTNRLAPATSVEGGYQVNAGMLTPYVSWSWNKGTSVWAMAGISSGDVTILDAKLALEEANTTLGAFATGIDLELITTPDGISLAVKGAAWGGQMDLHENAGRIRELDLGVYRFQLSLEGAYRIELANQGMFQPFVETGLRGDGGDGQTGPGLEIGGGARLSLPSAGLHITGRGQVLVLHGSTIDEWGFSGVLRYAPWGSSGPDMEVRSSTGQPFGSLQDIWQETRWHQQGAYRMAGTRIQSRLGYSFQVHHGSVIPYTGIELGHGAATRMGAEYQIGSRLRIRAEVAHQLQSTLYQGSPTLRGRVILR